MFYKKIDNKLHLELIHQNYAEEFLALSEKNKTYLSRWIIWLDEVNKLEGVQKSIENSLKSYTENKNLSCLIFYNNKMVGFISMWGMSSNPKMIRKGGVDLLAR